MRTWIYSSDTDAQIETRLDAVAAEGATCMIMLGDPGSGLAWMKHVVEVAGSRCDIYEFGNEPDNRPNNTSIAQTTAEWIADVPQLRALNPAAVFGGSAVTWSGGYDLSGGSYPSDVAYALAKTKAAGVRADFISYHDYPCMKATTEAQCVSMTPHGFRWNYDQVTGWEQAYYGGTIPTGVSEYNFDPGSNNLYAWGNDWRFMSAWETAAIKGIRSTGMAFANEFTTLNWSGYDYLDMFHDSKPYKPKAQEKSLAAAVTLYGGP